VVQVEESQLEAATNVPDSLLDELPTERAHPRLELRRVPGSALPAAPPRRAAGAVVTGIAVLVITAEVGRRSGAPPRLTLLCSVTAFTVVVAPRLWPAACAGRRTSMAGLHARIGPAFRPGIRSARPFGAGYRHRIAH
jgi:hypothetical protein